MADGATDTEAAEIEEGLSLEEECRTLFTEVEEAKSRLGKLATAAEGNNLPNIAALYREMSGTVLSILSDLTATVGGGFADIEEDVERLYARSGDGEPTESVLLEEDGKRYVAYLEQVRRLLEELERQASGQAEQAEVFKTLLRLTDELLTFTKEITVEEEDEDDEKEGEDDEPDADED
jgi:hypothetical protein